MEGNNVKLQQARSNPERLYQFMWDSIRDDILAMKLPPKKDFRHLHSSADEGNFINGREERVELEEYLGLAIGTLEGKNEIPYEIFKRLLLLMKKINDSKRQTSTMSTEVGAGFICDFKVNSKEFIVVSNAGMMANAASMNMVVTNNLLTTKRLMSIMAPVMMHFIVDHPPIIFKVIGVEWTRPEVQMAFKNVINFLQCLDDMNKAFPWAEGEYKGFDGQTIDPSFAYGITYYIVHGALSRQGKTQVDCHRIAHQMASKKVSRLINEGGYKLDNIKMREAE